MSYLGRSAKLSLKAQEKVSFLATAGQTVKTGLSYTPSFIEVYVNGVLLTDTTDFTATNGNSVTFTVALLLNDEVTVISLKTFTVADHYTKSDADTLLAAKAPLASPSFTGNVGIGVTPEAHHNSHSALQVGGNGVWTSLKAQGASGEMDFQHNAYYSQAHNGDRYISTDEATKYRQVSGAHQWYTAGSGSADAAISWRYGMQINNDGIVTKPLQPAFLVGSSGITNLAVNAYVTVPWNVSEIFDIGSNFASNRFTAPVTGKYQLAVSLRVENLDSASQYYILQFTTSNRTYRSIFDPDFGQDNGFWDFNLSTLADMDAGDTATVEIHQASGTAQTDINASANWSFFSGYLVC